MAGQRRPGPKPLGAGKGRDGTFVRARVTRAEKAALKSVLFKLKMTESDLIRHRLGPLLRLPEE